MLARGRRSAILSGLAAPAAIVSPGMSGQAPEKPVIAVAPVGRTPSEAVERLLPILRETFHCDAIAAPRVSVPASAFDSEGRQILPGAREGTGPEPASASPEL